MATANDRERVAAIEAHVIASISIGLETYAAAIQDKTETFDAADIRRLTTDARTLLDGYRALEARVRETEAELKTCKRKLNLERGFVEYLTGASDENL